MRFAARRPLMVLVVLMGVSTALIVGIAIKYRLSLWVALGAFYGALALGQIAYLTLAIAFGSDERQDGTLVDPVRSPLS